MQIAPSPDLSSIVKHYLILEGNVQAADAHRLFSDGNPGIIIQYGGTLLQLTKTASTQIPYPPGFLYGQISRFHTLFAEERIGLFAIVFKPFGLYALTGMQASTFTDVLLPLQDIWKQEGYDLQEKMLLTGDPLLRVRFVEDFLRQQQRHFYQPSPFICAALQLMAHHRGALSISQLAAQLNATERKMERSFLTEVGLSPKAYSGILRLQHFLHELRRKSANTSLTSLAYECGFSDQAHLIREFRKKVGITPLKYGSHAHPLAVNFIRLPAIASDLYNFAG